MKLLIVEDDADIREFVKIGLQAEGYTVDEAHDGEKGSYLAKTYPYSAIILDNSLPAKNGLDICEELRKSGSSVPILFLSVLGDAEKKIEAFQKGADDYMSKPFHFDELKARVKALIRRPAKIANPVLTIADIQLDTEKRMAYRNNTPIHLTRKEFNLLEYLMKNPDVAISRSMIMEHVWNAESDPFSNTVEAHILNLRKKINQPGKKDFIKNVLGRGYILES